MAFLSKDFTGVIFDLCMSDLVMDWRCVIIWHAFSHMTIWRWQHINIGFWKTWSFEGSWTFWGTCVWCRFEEWFWVVYILILMNMWYCKLCLHLWTYPLNISIEHVCWLSINLHILLLYVAHQTYCYELRDSQLSKHAKFSFKHTDGLIDL